MYKRLPDRKELQESAAILAAEDELSDNEIAQHCGITRRTLMRWKKQSAIQQKIDEHLRLSKQNSERQMIVERQMRIADMAVMLQKLEDIIRERAKTPEMRGVPGGSTGLMRRRKVSFRKPHGRDLEIAAACGINRRTLARWKEQPSVRTPVAEVRTTIFSDLTL